MNRTILITGATAGIGEATAKMFAGQGDRLILTGRRSERLSKLQASLINEFSVRVMTLAFDIRKRSEVEKALKALPPDWQEIDILVNNAGLAAGLDPTQDGDPDDWETMIDTNIKGLLFVTRTVLPWMVGRHKGHVVNIGSIAGKEVYPRGNVYCSTKFAVDALTRGMRIDLVGEGIRVTQVSPGAVETEFSLVRFKGDDEKAGRVYTGYQPLKAEDVAEIIRFVTSLPEHVNINDIVVMPTAQASAMIFNKK